MTRTNFTFSTPKSEAVLKAIRDQLAEGASTVLDLADAIDKSRFTVHLYLAHLRDLGAIVCVSEAKIRPQRGSPPAVWALNRPGAPTVPVVIEVEDVPDDDEVDRFPRRVVVRQQWEPHHVRMGFECYLFGVPAVLQREAA